MKVLALLVATVSLTALAALTAGMIYETSITYATGRDCIYGLTAVPDSLYRVVGNAGLQDTAFAFCGPWLLLYGLIATAIAALRSMGN